MALYRFRNVAVVGEWRDTRREACEDAIRVCLARRDSSQPDGIFWVVPTEIESSETAGGTANSRAFEPGLSRRRA